MKAIIYTRVSTKEQALQGMSLKSQEDICCKFAIEKGYEVDKIFVEEGESAKTTSRKRLLELIKYCSENKGKIDALIFYKTDRIARDSTSHYWIKTQLLNCGVKFVSATEPIDDTPIGKFIETVMAGSAQFDNDVKSERVSIGMTDSVKEGRWVWRPPLGYVGEKNEKEKTILVQDKAKAEIIKKAFLDYSTGLYSQLEILRMVNAEGLRTGKNKAVSKQTINNMLQNPVYAGFVPNPWENTIEQGIHEGIVTKEVFDACQAIRSGVKPSKTPRQRFNPDFPLRGLLKCPECDTPLTGSNSKGKTKMFGYYHCYKCGGIRVRADKTNNSFNDLLLSIKPSDKYVSDFREIFMDVWKQEFKEANQQRRKISQEILDLEDKKAKIMDLLADKKISDEDYKKRNQSLDLEITGKQLDKNDFRETEYAAEDLLNTAEWFLTRTDKIWQDLQPDLQQKFQQFVFPEGIVLGKDGTIGTPVLSPVYAIFNTSVSDKSTLVDHPRRC